MIIHEDSNTVPMLVLKLNPDYQDWEVGQTVHVYSVRTAMELAAQGYCKMLQRRPIEKRRREKC